MKISKGLGFFCSAFINFQIRICISLLFTGGFAFADTSLPAIQQEIAAGEAAVAGLKPGNEARLEFANPKRPAPTAVSLLYLHGFSASPKESSPLVENLASALGANAYFPRFKGHGIAGSDGLKGVKLEDWEQETRAALKTAKAIGEKVVVVAMSTGAAFAIPALIENQDQIAALVLISPNFQLRRWDARFLLFPFGSLMARLVFGVYREWKPQNSDHEYYWTTRYPSAALVEMAQGASRAKHSDLGKITVPVFVAYSPLDTIVSVSAIESALARIGSEKTEVFKVMEPEAAHNISGDILSPKTTVVLQKKIQAFLETNLIAAKQAPAKGKSRAARP